MKGTAGGSEYWESGAGDDARGGGVALPETPFAEAPMGAAPVAVAERSGPPAAAPGRPGAGPRLMLPRSAWVPVALALTAAAVAVGIVSGLGRRPAAGSSASRHPTATVAPTAAPRAATQISLSPAGAARAIDALLEANDRNRASVVSATNQIATCTAVGRAVAALEQRATDRQVLLGALDRLPLGALPGAGALAADLRQAWQSSAASDRAYAQWGRDEGTACHPDDVVDSNYRAARQSDVRASAAKSAFVAAWDRTAAEYGLEPWQPDHI